jgi:hypothetical protein
MAEEKKQEKKIIVDEDWKTQAQREKEQLKAKAEIEKEKQQGEAQEATSQQLPKGDLSTLISMLATQAMFAMGLIRAEKDKEPTVDLKLAKFNIDMLETLEEKTKGNISDEEQKMLTDAVSQLRMGYVKAAG